MQWRYMKIMGECPSKTYSTQNVLLIGRSCFVRPQFALGLNKCTTEITKTCYKIIMIRNFHFRSSSDEQF